MTVRVRGALVRILSRSAFSHNGLNDSVGQIRLCGSLCLCGRDARHHVMVLVPGSVPGHVTCQVTAYLMGHVTH